MPSCRCRQASEVPYGLDLAAAPGSFDFDGNYSPQPGSDGLTCASSVLEVLRGAGLDSVDLETWPQTFENNLWGNDVIKMVSKGEATKEHIAALGRNNRGLRLHPLEVAGSRY